jgi:hypothetical protein
MKFKSITLSKSKTIGVITSDNRTRFRKIQINATIDVEPGDDEKKSYLKLSEFIEDMFTYETTIK